MKTAISLSELSTLVLGGHLEPATDGRLYAVTGPATGEVLTAVPWASSEDVDRAVQAAKAAAARWARIPPRDRAQALLAFSRRLEAESEFFAYLDAVNSGNPIREMQRDVVLATQVIEYYASLATELKGETLPSTEETLHFSIREPYGVVGRIVAFNHPTLFAASRLAAPLVAGNAIIIKPAEQTPLSALALGRIALEVFPPGLINILSGDGPTTGGALVRHPDVRRIAFIGSTETGRLIQRQAAESAIKYVTLELGGKNPFIVFPDVDPHVVASAAVRGMNFVWQGQSCGSTSRLFVHERLYEEVVALVVERVRQIKVGHPLDEETQMGPLISRQHLERTLHYIESAVDEGARLVAGGGRPAGVHPGGFYLEPTVLADVQPNMRVAQEEIFGPVLSVLPWRNFDALIEAVNGVRYGLTASIWTNDLNQAIRTARLVESGYVWVNDVSAHYLGAGFGGYKDSGVGKEENLSELLSYTREKYINFRIPSPSP